MAIVAIYVVLAFAAFLTWLGWDREDNWIVIFSGMIFVFSGLDIWTNGFGELTQVYYRALSTIVIFLGGYLITRSGVEFVRDNV